MLFFSAGNVIEFVTVDVANLSDWIINIPFEAWPQQHSWKGQLRPAMVNNLTWYDFGAKTDSLTAELLSNFSSCRAYQRMLSVVMPGQRIEPHGDEQLQSWVGRVHVPLVSDSASIFIVGGVAYNLTVGSAYLINVREIHSVENKGNIPRIHFMFDVGEAS